MFLLTINGGLWDEKTCLFITLVYQQDTYRISENTKTMLIPY